MLISYFSAGFIDMASLIKMFVLCLLEKYLFETYESVTEFCWNPVFHMRPLTQLLCLRLDQQVGRFLRQMYIWLPSLL